MKREKINPAFPVEWFGLAVLALLAIPCVIGFSFEITNTGRLIGGLTPLILGSLMLRRMGWARTALCAEYLGIMALTASLVMIFNYASCALVFPLRDKLFDGADRALGFDWIGSFNYVYQHKLLFAVLSTAYQSCKFQMVFLALFFAARADTNRLREVFWNLLLGSLLTCIVGAFLPAMGAYRMHHLEISDYLPAIDGLRAGTLHSFSIIDGVGVITFPSFHTVMALINTYTARRTPAFWVLVVLNILMLISTPYFGGHYLVDMIAGAVISLVSILITQNLILGHDWKARIGLLSVVGQFYPERPTAPSGTAPSV